jgi:hypothetical protein
MNSNEIRYDHTLPHAGDPGRWFARRPDQQDDFGPQLRPFRHFVIPQLLSPDVFAALSAACRLECNRVILEQDDDERRMEYGPLLVRPAIDFFCGGRFRLFLSDSTGGKVTRAPTSVPQLRRWTGPTPELSPHTDAAATFTVATFFFVHAVWMDAWGGDTLLHHADLLVARRIAPTPNLMYGMFFGPDSLHSVTAIRGSHERLAIYQEWIVS